VSPNLPATGLALLPVAENVLDYIEAFFATSNVALPTRRYICPGVPSLDAWDCEQLVVGCVGITNGGARQGAASASPRAGSVASVLTIRQVVYGIQLVRCVPSIEDDTLPDPAEINKAGRQQLIDMGLLSQATVNLASSPPSWMSTASNVDAGAVAPIGPSGGYAGIEASLILTAFDVMVGDEEA
jgi:hypothetical protein